MNYENFQIDPDDPEFVQCVKLSIEEPFKTELEEGMLVTFRFSDGKKKRLHFPPESMVEKLYDFVWKDRNPNNKFYLVTDTAIKLTDVGIPIMSLSEDDTVAVFVNDQ